MKQEHFQWLIIVLVVLAVAGFGVVLHRQSVMMQAILRASSSVTVTPNPEKTVATPSASPQRSPEALPSTPRVTDIETVKVMTATPGQFVPNVEFVHRCVDGQVTTKHSDWDGKTHSFCVGRNQLVAKDQGREVMLSDYMVKGIADAPILFGAEMVGNIPADASNLALVSFSYETCTTTDDCGVGGPNHFVSYVYSLQTHTARSLAQFPRSYFGSPVWNKSFTKALFYPVTCGGGGCYPEALIGYNLETDKVNMSVTREKAVAWPESEGNELPTDGVDHPQPAWRAIEWTTDNGFRAMIEDVNHKTRWITGQF